MPVLHLDVTDSEAIHEALELIDDIRAAEAELDSGHFTSQDEEVRNAHAEREWLMSARQDLI